MKTPKWKEKWENLAQRGSFERFANISMFKNEKIVRNFQHKLQKWNSILSGFHCIEKETSSEESSEVRRPKRKKRKSPTLK